MGAPTALHSGGVGAAALRGAGVDVVPPIRTGTIAKAYLQLY